MDSSRLSLDLVGIQLSPWLDAFTIDEYKNKMQGVLENVWLAPLNVYKMLMENNETIIK